MIYNIFYKTIIRSTGIRIIKAERQRGAAMQEFEQNGEMRRQIGVIITCGTKETWRNTFDAMCENYYHDIEVGLQKEMVKNHCAFIVEIGRASCRERV